MSRDALIDEVAVLQGIVRVARDAQGAEGVVDPGPKSPADLKREAAGASASRDFIVASLRDRQFAGMRLTQAEENFLALSELGRSASGVQDSDCPVCYDSMTIEDAVVMPGCGHMFCKGCFRDHVLVKVRAADTTRLLCPEEECTTRIPPAQIDRCLAGAEYASDREKYERFSLDSYLDGTGSRMICPKRECQASFLVEHTSPRMVCPHCRHCFCGHCPGKPDWHVDSTCEAYQEWAIANGTADDEFRALLADRKSRIKPCPRCRGPVFKPPRSEGGACNHMTCACKHQWCWLCGVDYKAGHFNEDGPCHGKQFYDEPDTT